MAEEGRRDWGRWARWIIALVLVTLAVVFIAQNYRTVELRFLFFDGDTRLAWALIAMAVAGLVAGLILPRLRR